MRKWKNLDGIDQMETILMLIVGLPVVFLIGLIVWTVVTEK